MESAPNEASGQTVVCMVRLWLPDRPGMLGQLATQIGAVGGDVVGIDILERGGGRAVDELTVVLPAAGLVDALVLELGLLSGVAVEDVRVVPRQPPDAGTLALGVAARLAEVVPEQRHELLCAELHQAFAADWVVLISDAAPEPVQVLGPSPDPIWLAAFVAGSRHLGPEAHAASAPSDLAWASVGCSMTVVIGRRGTPFHSRERTQLLLLGRIVAALSVPSPVG